jgi:beta-hydroxylase
LGLINLILPSSTEFYSTDLDWAKKLRNSTGVILKEYKQYSGKLKRFKEIDEYQTIIDTGSIPWDILMLRVYNKDTNKIIHFPKTFQLIKDIPGCSLAMFSVLPPGKKLDPHYGVYKGILRYHLGLIIPKNKEDCTIMVNGKKKYWERGKDLMFDDTFIHSVNNNTDETRVILFLDIQKQFNNIFLDTLNSIILYFSQFNGTVNEIVNNTNKV